MTSQYNCAPLAKKLACFIHTIELTLLPLFLSASFLKFTSTLHCRREFGLCLTSCFNLMMRMWSPVVSSVSSFIQWGSLDLLMDLFPMLTGFISILIFLFWDSIAFVASMWLSAACLLCASMTNVSNLIHNNMWNLWSC